MLNKKVLAVAILGGLFAAGNAVAAPLEVTTQYYANEIVFPADGLEPAAAPALNWNVGYNFSAGEVKYVRVELTGATFNADLALPTIANGNVGAINGLGTNVITFSVTSNGTGIVATDKFSLPLSSGGPTPTGFINIPTKRDVSATVSLYDQASQAQAGGPTGRLSIGSYDDTVFLTFAKSYAFSNKANTLTASIEADPIYSDFVVDAATDTTATIGTLNADLRIVLVDPDGTGPNGGPQTVTLAADGSPITLDKLFSATSKIEVEGDFSAGGSVTLDGVAVDGGFVRTAKKVAWTSLPSALTAPSPLVYTVDGTRQILAGDYKATFLPVSADASAYTVTPLTAAVVGTVRRDGLELQAPLAQVPAGWTSRLVLTNTGAASPKYTIKVLGEDGNTITTDSTKLAGTVKPGTNVIDLATVMTGFTAAPRGTVVVSVEARDQDRAGTIQGLYQIVNGGTGSISNHVLVRPGTN